jgi:type IV pilus assembly protein PilN
MIRINLLPVRAAKKKETALQQIFIFCAGVVAVLVLVLSLWGIKMGQIAGTNNDINAANAKISELKTKIGKLDEIKKLRDEVKKKLDVLAALRKNKTGPAQSVGYLK